MEGNDEGRNSHREKVMGYEAGQANQKTEGEEPRVLNMELRNSGRWRGTMKGGMGNGQNYEV